MERDASDPSTSMNVSLPTSLRGFVEEQVAARGYTSASEYIRELIRRARERQLEQGRLEALLLEGIDSGPAEPFGAEFFESLRARVRAARASKNEAS